MSDASFPETSFQGGHQETGYQEPAYQEPAYQEPAYEEPGYQEPSFQDASYEDASFPEELTADAEFGPSEASQFEEESEPLHLGVQDASFDVDQDYDAMADQSGDGYQPHAGHQGASHGYAAIPSNQALQSFDAVYDQPPQIALGATSAPGATQGYYEGEQPDADFLDDGQFEPGMESVQPQPGRKLGLRSRSMFMVGSALLGAVALGGALAFAYKQSGGSMSSGETPVVQADTSPVKEAPQNAGGKEFPHKNKLIYERLQNGDQPEAERIVPRQEELAMPAMPGAGPVAAPPAVATVDDPDGGPRRVKTLVVRPDGSVMAPPAPAAEPAPAPAPAAAAGRRSAGAPGAPAASRGSGRQQPTHSRLRRFRRRNRSRPRHQRRQRRANMWSRSDRSRIRPMPSPPSPTCSRNIRRCSRATGRWCRRPISALRASGTACALARSPTNRPRTSFVATSNLRATPTAW